MQQEFLMLNTVTIYSQHVSITGAGLSAMAEWYEVSDNAVIQPLFRWKTQKRSPDFYWNPNWFSGVLATALERLDVRLAHDIMFFVWLVPWESHGVKWDRKKCQIGKPVLQLPNRFEQDGFRIDDIEDIKQ